MRKTSLKILLAFVLLSILFTYKGTNLYSQEAKIRIIKENAILRLEPSHDSLPIRELPVGSELEVVETVQNWIKVKLPPDKDGIIVTGYVNIFFAQFEIKPTPKEQELKPSITKPTFKLPQTPELPAISADSERDSWERAMAIARARESTADSLGWTGFGLSLLGWGLYFGNKEEVWEYDIWGIAHREEKPKIEYLITGIGGTALGLIGFIIGESAKNEIKVLEIERARKGYMSAWLSFLHNGFVIKLKYSF